MVSVPVNLSKLSDVAKNDVAKKAVYEKLSPEVNNINTSKFVLKTKYQTDKTELENKIPDVTDFVKKTKLTEIENKIPDISSLVKKTDYHTKNSELEKKLADHDLDKYITIPEFNTSAASVFNARLAQVNLITKRDLYATLSSLRRKVTSNKTKHLLAENEMKKLKSFDLGYFIEKAILMRMMHNII